VGAGGEYKWGHWVARADYRYSDFGTMTVDTFGSPSFVLPTIGAGINSSVHVRTQTATVGLGWLFYSEPAAVRARY
jgi:opacity protein-like surface antigen